MNTDSNIVKQKHLVKHTRLSFTKHPQICIAIATDQNRFISRIFKTKYTNKTISFKMRHFIDLKLDQTVAQKQNLQYLKGG